MGTKELPLQPDFRERAKANDVPIARLIGFEAKKRAGYAGEFGPQLVCAF